MVSIYPSFYTNKNTNVINSGMHAGDFAYTVYAMIHKSNILYRTCVPLKELVDHGRQTYDFTANKAKFKGIIDIKYIFLYFSMIIQIYGNHACWCALSSVRVDRRFFNQTPPYSERLRVPIQQK